MSSRASSRCAAAAGNCSQKVLSEFLAVNPHSIGQAITETRLLLDEYQVVLEKAPGVLGWARWRALDEEFTGKVLLDLIARLADIGLIEAPNPALLARPVCALVAEAALTLAAAKKPEVVRDEVLVAVEQLLSGARRRG
jgi:hypothetical protein